MKTMFHKMQMPKETLDMCLFIIIYERLYISFHHLLDTVTMMKNIQLELFTHSLPWIYSKILWYGPTLYIIICNEEIDDSGLFTRLITASNMCVKATINLFFFFRSLIPKFRYIQYFQLYGWHLLKYDCILMKDVYNDVLKLKY